MKAPPGYRIETRDFGESIGWVFGTPDGRWSDDCYISREVAIEFAVQHSIDPTHIETVDENDNLA